MTHDELLTKVDKLTDQDFGVVLGPALRAVVELHKPTQIKYKWGEDGLGCLTCLTDYPCPTIQTIEKELGQ